MYTHTRAQKKKISFSRQWKCVAMLFFPYNCSLIFQIQGIASTTKVIFLKRTKEVTTSPPCNINRGLSACSSSLQGSPCPFSDWGSSLLFTVCREYFYHERNEISSKIFWHLLRWFHGFSFLLHQYGILHWLNQILIIWNSYLLMVYYYLFILLNLTCYQVRFLQLCLPGWCQSMWFAFLWLRHLWHQGNPAWGNMAGCGPFLCTAVHNSRYLLFDGW